MTSSFGRLVQLVGWRRVLLPPIVGLVYGLAVGVLLG
jgi:hypothetical protein